MKTLYKIEIGVQKAEGHISLRDKVEIEEDLLIKMVNILKGSEASAIINLVNILGISEGDRIDYLELKED